MHRTVDEGRVGRSRAHAHLNDGGAEVRRRARHCAHGQVGVENENSTDSPGMPRKLFRKGSHVSHVDIVLRLPIGRGGRRRRSTGFELSDHFIEALRESLGRALGYAPVTTLDFTCGVIAHTDGMSPAAPSSSAGQHPGRLCALFGESPGGGISEPVENTALQVGELILEAAVGAVALALTPVAKIVAVLEMGVQ